jgi:hypothetical protein
LVHFFLPNYLAGSIQAVFFIAVVEIIQHSLIKDRLLTLMHHWLHVAELGWSPAHVSFLLSVSKPVLDGLQLL